MRGRSLLFAVAVAACTEFPNELVKTVTLQPMGWAAVSVTEIDTIAVQIPLSGGSTQITGLRITWQSSDSTLLRVVQLQPSATGSREDTLTAQLRAEITGMRGGVDTVSVVIAGGGAFEPVVVRDTIRVMQNWVGVSAGYNHSCGVTIDDRVFCWGTGQLGNGSANGSPVPVEVLGQLRFTAVTAGDGYSCGVLTDGRAYCWGRNLNGAIGNGLLGDQLTPVAVSLGRTFASVTAGEAYACGLASDSTGFCWGDNIRWQLGDALVAGGRPTPSFDKCGSPQPTLCSLRPRPIEPRNPPPMRLLSVAPSTFHTCAVLDTHTPVCWGSGSLELGSTVGLTTDSASPTPFVTPPGGLGFTTVAAGLDFTCGVEATTGQIYCWGFNSIGQLGRTGSDSARPLEISGPSRRYVAVDGGEASACAIASDMHAYCWGSNQFGQLGTTQALQNCGGVNCSRTPLLIPSLADSDLVSLSVSVSHGCAVTVSGAAYCWGQATGGKLGNATLANSTSLSNPVRVSEPR